MKTLRYTNSQIMGIPKQAEKRCKGSSTNSGQI